VLEKKEKKKEKLTDADAKFHLPSARAKKRKIQKAIPERRHSSLAGNEKGEGGEMNLIAHIAQKGRHLDLRIGKKEKMNQE